MVLRKDVPFLKFTLKFARLLVVWELVIDTLHSTLLLYMIWQYLIDNFSNEAFLEVTPWSITSTAALTALSACPIQIYLSHRVKKLSGSWVVFTPLFILSLAEVWITRHCDLNTNITSDKSDRIDSYYNASRLVSIHIKNPVSVATDVSISVCLIFYLRKKRTGIRPEVAMGHRDSKLQNTDHTFPLPSRRIAEDILVERKRQYYFQVFSGVTHGFASRGDPNIPDERWGREQSAQGISGWFHRFLDERFA
ncbi:hypothetical protein D9757_004572 [Collybiopsis confluens]|uniref:Uncharacterized protein n=1 Tax=Collybiopsis confluens TaxID=2823264 RepID=A0A8H5HWV1_9AGAR|nr:hypothetical protein D9757_004572 [Collybiopsis confluens]